MENRKLDRKALLQRIDPNRLPQHVAIIMDGNGRWAKKRGITRQMGHRAGAEALRTVLTEAEELGVYTISVFAFSTENWKRSSEEVGFIMDLLVEYIKNEVNTLHDRGVKVTMLGDMDGLPLKVQKEFRAAEELTAQNRKMFLNLGINYGGRREILQATRKIAAEVAKGRLEPDEINEELIVKNLYTAGQPDPDLLIRPSGELRISNFLLWQLAYAELYFTPVLWPDFDGMEFLRAICEYQQRDRRFGGRAEDKG